MDLATPNLPSTNFEATSRYYGALGFHETWRDGGWMVLKLRNICLEFFLHPDLEPAESWFSCCIHLDDLSSFYESCQAAGISERKEGWPRLHAPKVEPSGLTIAYMSDCDGTLLRLIQNESPGA
ncbi:MAG: bleomycin resistance protein [Erythrobacter sp.]